MIQTIYRDNPLFFVAAITPFNFTAIAGNLSTAPLLFGNCVYWQPSDSSILSNHLFYEIMIEAGLPKGVLNFCPMNPGIFLNRITERKDLGGILFTGSSRVFQEIYYNIGMNIPNYENFPRLIGETGGKNFHFVDNSYDKYSSCFVDNDEINKIYDNDYSDSNNISNIKFDLDLQYDNCTNNLEFVIDSTIESAFNYSGQKCSACSIMYIPESLLDTVIPKMKYKLKIFLVITIIMV